MWYVQLFCNTDMCLLHSVGMENLRTDGSFQGGKIESGETGEQAIIREIHEELNTEILPVRLLDIIEEDYPTFHIKMYCYLCEIKSGELELLEHESARWLDKAHIYDVAWLPADLDLIKRIVEKLL